MNSSAPGRLLIAAIFALLAIPSLAQPAGAQEDPGEEAETEVTEVTVEEIENFARAHLEIEEIRDQLHEEMAQWHDEDRQQEAREEADQKILETLEEHGITPEEYEEFTRVVSIDEEHRSTFEEVLSELEGTDR